MCGVWHRHGVAVSLCIGALTLPAGACSERLDLARADLAWRAAIVGVNPAGDLALPEGATARLRGLVHPRAAAASPWRAALTNPGAVVTQDSALAAGALDRWGRRSADGWMGQTGENLALALLRRGDGLAWPAELPPNCRILYLEAEAAARDARRGLWALPDQGLMEAADGAAVAARAGEIAVMQGTVAHVGQTRRALYLNFGPRGVGASAELPVSVWRALERTGVTRASLLGRAVRLRGVAHLGRPARLVVDDAAHMEWLR